MRRTMLSLLAAACVGLVSTSAGAQANDDRTVRITVRSGALPDKDAIRVDQDRLVFQPGRRGRITWQIDTGEYEFDNDGGKLGIVIYELGRETDPPNKNFKGKADTEFACSSLTGNRFHCDNKNTGRGFYWYEIRLKEKATGRRRSSDPIILNL
jgi:hypothetical protein